MTMAALILVTNADGLHTDCCAHQNDESTFHEAGMGIIPEQISKQKKVTAMNTYMTLICSKNGVLLEWKCCETGCLI